MGERAWKRREGSGPEERGSGGIEGYLVEKNERS